MVDKLANEVKIRILRKQTNLLFEITPWINPGVHSVLLPTGEYPVGDSHHMGS